MTLSSINKTFKQFEQQAEQRVPTRYLIVRLDGHGFGRLTHDHFEKPFDERFHRFMLHTVESLFCQPMKIKLAYTQSDEISLLIDMASEPHGCRQQKITTILAGLASADFSLQLGKPAVFDCRALLLPDNDLIKQYFMWRYIDAGRNALNQSVYWFMRYQGLDAQEATQQLKRKTQQELREQLTNLNNAWETLPLWQRSGTLYKVDKVLRHGINRLTHQPTVKVKNQVVTFDGFDEQTLKSALADVLNPDNILPSV